MNNYLYVSSHLEIDKNNNDLESKIAMMTENVQVTRLRPRQPIQSEHQETWDVQTLARKFVTDPIYLTNLRKRLRAGEARALEPTLWKYAYGQPNESLSLGDHFLDRRYVRTPCCTPGAGRRVVLGASAYEYPPDSSPCPGTSSTAIGDIFEF